MEESATAADVCAICLAEVGPGQAIFTAECSHAFHHRCISDSVAHGHRDCPLCKATWRDLPFVNPVLPPPPPPRRTAPAFPPARPYRVLRSVSLAATYDDDDELVGQETGPDQACRPANDVGEVVVRTHCERPAVPRDASHDSFPVLLHVKAPGPVVVASDTPRAPLDLVTVLDLSGSMRGEKLELLKQAVGFVIDNLGAADRLSVVSFSDTARRVLRLALMSADGKASARRAVESLVARGGTNIGEGLRVGAKVLDDRRYRNAVTGIILLSDGRDGFVKRQRYVDLVPDSLRGTAAAAGNWTVPIHTFGFGADHDAAAMHTVAEETGGTFSFVENQEVIQDSFAQCIGGLLSVAVQDARIAVTCVHPGVRVLGIRSGSYENRIDADRRAASVDVGELYADEERRFLIFVRVPRAEDTEDATQLIKVSCTYRDTATGLAANVAGEDAVVLRPDEVPDGDADLSMEVERERVRVAATEDLAAARAAAERGEHAEAARILESRQDAVRLSAPGLAGDPTCAALEDELSDLRARVASRREYEQTGRAFMLAGMSSHGQQRASSSVTLWGRRGGGRSGGRGGRGRLYETPIMRSMVKKSQTSREHQDLSSPAKKMRRST